MALITTFCCLAAVCGVVLSFRRSGYQPDTTNKFKRFERNFLVVFVLALASDWLQGPYTYSLLHESHGLDKGAISNLLTSEYLAATLGALVLGTLADYYGRKRLSVLYGLLCAISCICSNSQSMAFLLLGRCSAGLAKTVLLTTFESWLVAEHFRLDFPGEWMPGTFSIMSFLNALSALVCSLIASLLVKTFGWGFSAPANVALLPLLLATLITAATWTENFGDKKGSTLTLFTRAVKTMLADQRLILLGMVESLVEGAMYTHAFLWLPTLQADGRPVQSTMVFACGMLCAMTGSLLAPVLMPPKKARSSESHLRPFLLVAASALLVPVYTQETTPLLGAFFAFEFCIGVYLPSIMRLRSLYIPGEFRSSIMCLYRVPLNAMVAFLLSRAGLLASNSIYLCCATWLLLAALCQQALCHLAKKPAVITGVGAWLPAVVIV